VLNNSFREGLKRHRYGLDKVYELSSAQARATRPAIPADRDTVSQRLSWIVVVFGFGAALTIFFIT
jgi:hypothetical protein